MARTFIRQSTQIANSDVYNDQIEPVVGWESATNIEEDLNHLRSQIQNILNRDGDTMPAGNWYDNINTPNSFENGRQRGLDALNTDLHDLQRKRVLTSFVSLAPITVPNGQNYVVLDADDEVPNPGGIGKVIALSSPQTGSVAAHIATFEAHSLGVVNGATAISPKNLMMIVTGSNRDPLLYENNIIYGLLQVEDNTNGHTLDNSSKRAQISFVYVDPVAGNVFLAAPASAVQDQVINYTSTVRKALADLSEQDFLRGAEIDVPSTSATTRQNAYENQSDTPVEVGNNAILDLGTNFYWTIRDQENNDVFKITEGHTNGDTTIEIAAATDLLDVNASEVDFASGIKVATAGASDINIGVNAGIIETTANDLKLLGAAEIYLNDGNRAGSTWAGADGIKLSEDSAEWSAFETAFDGEVSLLKALTNSRRRDKVYSIVSVDVAADTNVTSPTNIDVAFPDMSIGTFDKDYDVYLNGQLLLPGVSNDYKAGTNGTSLKFNFGLKQDDIICVVPYVRS